MKLCLGTAQIGIKGYGINNITGGVVGSELFDILYQYNLNTIDTSCLYGDIETVIRDYNKKDKLKIYTKITSQQNLDSFLHNTKLSYVQGCYIHHFDDFQNNPAMYDVLQECQRDGKVHDIGFSIYHEHELEYILDNIKNIQIIQIPYNIFDRRFEKYFQQLATQNIQINVRSCFMQGLIFKYDYDLQYERLNQRFSNKIQKIRRICYNLNMSIAQLFYFFCELNEFISQVIIGHDSTKQLTYNVNKFTITDEIYDHISDVMDSLLDLREDDLKILLAFTR